MSIEERLSELEKKLAGRQLLLSLDGDGEGHIRTEDYKKLFYVRSVCFDMQENSGICKVSGNVLLRISKIEFHYCKSFYPDPSYSNQEYSLKGMFQFKDPEANVWNRIKLNVIF